MRYDKEKLGAMIALGLIVLVMVILYTIPLNDGAKKGAVYANNGGQYTNYNGVTHVYTEPSDHVLRCLADYGYSYPVLSQADIGDAPGYEYLCLCQKDGVWYLVVFVYEDYTPYCVLEQDLSHTAVYLVDVDGQQCLMLYSQQITTQSDGLVHTDYSYEIQRFNASGQPVNVDAQQISYTDNDRDATHVASYLQTLNRYLIRIVVIRDPYRLTGREWLDESQVIHGSVPQQEQIRPEEPEPEKQTMGFVQIQDPSSWLNLRVGPGTQYAKVLLDSWNPNSFVRQAQGSPVTILETIETGDWENPVWVKVRISYSGREIVGYCSKRYIRLAE